MFRHKLLILTDRRYIVIVVAETAYTDIFRNFQRHGIAGLDQAVSHPVIFTYDGRDAAAFQSADILLERFLGRIRYLWNDIFRLCGKACVSQRIQISPQALCHRGRTGYAFFGEKADFPMTQGKQMLRQLSGARDIVAQNIVQIGRGHRLVTDDYGNVAEYKRAKRSR